MPTSTCPTCGYDLAGLPDRVCPECGREAHGLDPHPLRVKSIVGAVACAGFWVTGLLSIIVFIRWEKVHGPHGPAEYWLLASAVFPFAGSALGLACAMRSSWLRSPRHDRLRRAAMVTLGVCIVVSVANFFTAMLYM